MNICRLSFISGMSLSVLLACAAGCGPASDCPACDHDESLCGDVFDDMGVTGDVDAVEPADTAVAVDGADGGETDGPDDVINEILTGTASIIGRAHFTNMDDHSGFQVSLYLDQDRWDTLDPILVDTRVTAADGRYRFTRLPAGYYYVSITHGPMTLDGVRLWGTLHVGEGESLEVVDLSFTAVGAVSGRLVFEVDEWNPQLTIVFTSERTHVAFPDPDGNFVLEGLLPGVYVVCAGASYASGRCVDNVAVAPLETTPIGDLVMVSPDTWPGDRVSISGRVTLFGQEDSSGILVTYNPGDFQVVTQTDAAGEYSFENVVPGRADLIFDAPDGSGYEQGSAAIYYQFYAGTSERLPEQVLVRGKALWRTDIFGFAAGAARFTPDGTRIVLRSWNYQNLASPGPSESGLYVVDISGGAATRLAGSVEGFLISPDSTRAVYASSFAARLLTSVPLAGGPQVVLTTENQFLHMISPDSRFAIFSKYQYGASEDYATWASDIATGAERRLCGGYFQFMTDDSRYVGGLTQDEALEIVRVEGPTTVYSGGNIEKFIVGGDGHTVFVCHHGGQAEIVDLDTAGVAPIADTLRDCGRVLLTPAADMLIYQSDDGFLKAMPIGGGAPVSLDRGDLGPLAVTPDGTRVIYGVGPDSDNRVDVRVVDIAGLTEPIPLMQDVYRLGLVPPNPHNLQGGSVFVDRNSENVFVILHGYGIGSIELVRVALDGSGITSFGVLCNTACSVEDSWRFDEDLGLIYASKPVDAMQVMDAATGEVLRVLNVHDKLGTVASDLSGTVTASDDSGAIGWVGFPDLTYTPLGPLIGLDSPNSLFEGRSAKLSPDNSMIMFKSTFGARSYPLDGTIDHRIMVAPLK